MDRFGTLKTKILQKFTDAYANGNKSEIKKILKIITENKDFRNLYLFYEEIENKYIENKNDAEIFVDSIMPILREQKLKVNKFIKDLNKNIGDISISENLIYQYLDIISEDDTLKNVDRKINSRKKLIEHLTIPKKPISTEEQPIIENETLLNTVLVNNFNILYSNTLTEEQKDELKNILDIKTEELETNFKTLKEEVSSKMTNILSEEKNDDVIEKINQVLKEMTTMDVSKFNYYKLLQLKNGL